jgi:DNA repair exonuclease SbcCD ATPase subunit
LLLRNLRLKNLRSYNDGEEVNLNLPEGVILFEGDTGSGKSTLLYALEFALFGFSDMKGAHLLSEGRRDGKVSLTFESDGTEYIVERSLRLKGDAVTQDECSISSGGVKERLSPSDLKERVVSILGFNEPTHPKAESLVYRYAVFTPQEQMKEILLQNSDERLHVIRRVLGAQSYQVAAENSEVVGRRIRETAYGLRKAGEDLEQKKSEAAARSKTLAHLESEIPKLRQAESLASKRSKTLEAEWKRSRDEREALTKSVGRIPLIKQDLDALKASVEEDDEKLRGLEVRLATDLAPTVARFRAMPKPERTVDELEEESDAAKERLGQLTESKRNLEAELAKTRDLLARGICPLCGQRISGDASGRTQHLESEIARVANEIYQVEGLLGALSQSLEAARAFGEAAKASSRAEEDQERVEKEIRSLRKRIQESNMRASKLASELAESEREARAMREVSDRIEDLDAQLERARDEERRAGRELTEATTELVGVKRELESLTAEIQRKEEALLESRRLGSYQTWLSLFFRPAVELIEKQTLVQAAARFNEHFQRFFTSLVDDPDLVVRVKEDFSPIFEREGFEQEYAALSGGERTSMALAYRFALNAVVRESVSSRPELLILDEPTDGFSKEQVYKMRALLEELDSRQVILVSHERELESMADHIFKVEKRNGASSVSEARAD